MTHSGGTASLRSGMGSLFSPLTSTNQRYRWGARWQSCHVIDNMAVVEILKSRTSKDETIMHLLGCLHFLCAKHGVRISAMYIPGIENIPARNHLDAFFASSPKSQSQPSRVPRELWELVVATQPELALTMLEMQAERYLM